jgi:3-oxoacyl-[acyl-carrier protein] reductase
MTDYGLSGKVACITGASRGIGLAVAEAFAQQGVRLLLLARSEPVLTTGNLPSETEVIARRCDVASLSDVKKAAEAAFARWGQVDVLVNAAAILGATGETWNADPAQWTDAIQTNLIGTFHTARVFLPGMIERRAGKIVNFAGGGAAYGYPRFSAYASSKAAVVRFSETLALECAPHGVQVNAIAPGAIETDLLRQVQTAGGEVRTVGTMSDAVALILYLASNASGHVTGRFIHARDEYTGWPESMPADRYTLRRVQA